MEGFLSHTGWRLLVVVGQYTVNLRGSKFLMTYRRAMRRRELEECWLDEACPAFDCHDDNVVYFWKKSWRSPLYTNISFMSTSA